MEIDVFDLTKDVYHICLLTSGQVLAFDQKDNQIFLLQASFGEGKQNPYLLKKMAENASKFNLVAWDKWVQELTKEEFIKITHLNYF